MYMNMKIHVYSTLAKLAIKGEKKTQTQYTTPEQYKHKMTSWVPSLENWDGGLKFFYG